MLKLVRRKKCPAGEKNGCKNQLGTNETQALFLDIVKDAHLLFMTIYHIVRVLCGSCCELQDYFFFGL